MASSVFTLDPDKKTGIKGFAELRECLRDDVVASYISSYIMSECPCPPSREESASALSKAASRNINICRTFQCCAVPDIKLRDYIANFRRLLPHAPHATSVWITALIYLHRLKRLPGVYINIYTVHRLVLGCIVLAAKFVVDAPPHAAHFAHAGGVSFNEMCCIERNVLRLLDFRLTFPQAMFNRAVQSLLFHIRSIELEETIHHRLVRMRSLLRSSKSEQCVRCSDTVFSDPPG